MNIIHNLGLLLLMQLPLTSVDVLKSSASRPVQETEQEFISKKAIAENLILKSNDGGETWQDISEGLPESVQADGLPRDGFIANDTGLFLRVGNGIYYSKPNSPAPFWKKETLYSELSIAPGNTKIFAYNYDGQFLQKKNGASDWSAMYTSFQKKEVRNVFESAGGAVFIGSSNGLFKSTNNGQTWKQVHTWGWVMKLVEANGILLATSEWGILRSTDGGEKWDWVISEGGVGIAVECIKGGFAAITYNEESMTRRIRTSYDGGKTWQAIDAGLPASLLISSIVQVGESFFCGHPDGIYRSSDKGKTWKLLLPSIENKVYNLTVSGNVIYAIPRNGGC